MPFSLHLQPALPRPPIRGKRSMSSLVLELRKDDVMIVNGAPIRFRTKSSIELAAKARFLFGKQIMAPDQAHTPARRIYFALQAAYIGTNEERERGLVAARQLIDEFQEATTSQSVRDTLDQALVAAEADDCYRALKLARQVIRHEDLMLGDVRPPGGQAPAAANQSTRSSNGQLEIGGTGV
jgi:flagellar protein FlbT